MSTPPTNPDHVHLRQVTPVPVPLSDWRRDLEVARTILAPVVRSRVLEALCAAQLAAFEEMRRQGVTP